MADVIYSGKFLYAGGHPELAKPGLMWSKPQVVVTADGLEYREGKITKFSVAKDAIVRVDHETGAVGGFGGDNDQFIVVEMNRGDRAFAIRFKAAGMTQQKDAFGFNAALNSFL